LEISSPGLPRRTCDTTSQHAFETTSRRHALDARPRNVSFSSVNSDLTEQVPNRLAILRDNRQLIAESIGRLVKRSRILRASTP
jgi:hypothetical protein